MGGDGRQGGGEQVWLFAHEASCDDRLEVARQQCRPARTADAQHAAAVVAQVREKSWWMQEAERHAIPIPCCTSQARLVVLPFRPATCPIT